MSTKTQELISDIVINEKNEKQYQITGIPRTHGACSDKVTPDIDGFTDKLVVQCYVQVVESTFMDNSK